MLALIAFAPRTEAADGMVVTTIRPLYSLVAGVMGETGTPAPIIAGSDSLHGYQLTPSQIKMLRGADIIFYIDGDFERFLPPEMATLPAHIRRVALARQPGIKLLSRRGSGAWEPHDHHEATQGMPDLHLWLDPRNAMAMVRAIAMKLEETYPENQAAYAKNADLLIEKIKTLDRTLENRLKEVKHKPFIVFHDAYQYFERRYGLAAAGSITLEPEQPPSAGRLREIRKKLKASGALCVFREPQFSDRLVHTVMEGSSARSGTLDDLGGLHALGPDLYFGLMEDMAKNLEECLNGSG